MRTWTDATGKHKVEAKFQKMDGDIVVLLKANGRNARLPLKKLSEPDQEFLTQLLAKESIPNKATPNASKTRTPVGKKAEPTVAKTDAATAASKLNQPPPGKNELAPGKPPAKLVRPVVQLAQSDIDALPEGMKADAATLFKGTDFAAIRAVLNSLKDKWPQGSNETLIKLLQRTSTSQGKFCRLMASELLIKHDAEKSLPFILLQVNDSSQDVRWQTLDFIEEKRPPEALPLLIEIFTGPEQSKVSRILAKYGSVVEPLMEKYLTSRNAVLRMETCSLLANVGTSKSIKQLEKIQNFDSNASVSLQAKSAIRKIKKREAKKETD